MELFLKDLDYNLKYINSVIKGNTIWIYCETEIDATRKVHSRQERIVKDIPYGKYKTELHIISKKYFNSLPEENGLTSAEKFTFINSSGRRTKRLDNLLMNLHKETSAIGLERIIKDSIVDISDTTILRILKKNRKLT